MGRYVPDGKDSPSQMLSRLALARPALQSVLVTVVVPDDGTENPIPQAIPHRLGKVPRYWSVKDENSSGGVYRDETDKWTSKEISLTFPAHGGKWVIELS
jgi:hypothetical protein